MIDEIAKANALDYIASKTMRDYYEDQELSEKQLTDIILGAPASLHQKLFTLSRFFNTEENYRVINLLIDGLDNWERELNDNEVFVLIEYWFDHSELKEKNCFRGVFKSHAKIHDLLAREYKELDDDDSPLYGWYEVERWVCDKGGSFDKKYSYVILRHEACFFTKYEKRGDGLVLPLYGRVWEHYTKDFPPFHFDDRLSESSDLNLPIPFKVGDLVRIDCLPFMEAKPAVIVELYDNNDCCGVKVVCRNEDGTYGISPLKHSHMFTDNYRSLISPLYRLDYFEDEYDYKDILMEKAKKVTEEIRNGGYGSEKMYSYLKAEG